MKQFLSFVRKEFIHIFRDFRSLLILLIVPQLMVIILGYVIKNEVEDVRVAVIDPSHDVYSNRITERLSANKYFILQDEVQTEAEALAHPLALSAKLLLIGKLNCQSMLE